MADLVKPVILTILDGWGHNPDSKNNAIAQAHTPNWDRLNASYPTGLINASELHVGLPSGQMGNSEVGHMNIGSGRLLMQDLPKIDKAIADGSLEHNIQLQSFIAKLKKSGGACHLMGLLSPGGVHSHQSHVAALANILADAGIQVWVHAFLDGRDTPPQSAESCAHQFIDAVGQHYGKAVRFATAMGRYYAMDRDKRWERVQAAYDAMVNGGGEWANDILNVIGLGYQKVESDEFISPSVIGGGGADFEHMKDGDGVLVCNFRADRVREILTALLDESGSNVKIVFVGTVL